MRKVSCTVLAVLGLGFLFGFLSGCGKKESRQLTPIEEAYRLMDHGENAKAILVLEKELKEHPGNDEARQLLASGYAGLAGVDIYAIHDAFQDVLFRRSLRDELKGKGNVSEEPRPVQTEEKKDLPSVETQAEETIKKLDRTFASLQKVVLYLARFPQIPEEKWIYLEKALFELNGLNETSDIPVYRILLRLVYVKSYLVQEIIRDEDFGTKAWACSFEFADLRQGFAFVNEQLEALRNDAKIAVEKGAKKLAKGDSVLVSVMNATNLTESLLALDESLTVQSGRARLRNTLGCDYAR